MSKLPVGPHNVHVQKTQGADTNIMKFYITQNSTTYGARWEKFQPRPGFHKGTGYLRNYRPSIYYSRELDDIDNPAMRRICDGNYRSITTRDFQPYRGASGHEIFPRQVFQTPTGYIRERVSIPIDREVPKNLKTETQEQFGGKPWTNNDTSKMDIGPIQPSGFVRSGNEEPLTFESKIAYENLKPGWLTHRPTGVSITKTSFIPKKWSRGGEPLPGGISTGSDRGTGFTREEVKPKYASVKPDGHTKFYETPYLTHKQDDSPQKMESVQHEQFKGQMKAAPTEADRLNKTNFGIKTETGFVRNNAPYIDSADDKMRFLTHYMTRFGPDPTPVGVDRAGHLRGGIQLNRSNGYIKSTTINSFGNELPSTDVLHKIEPYVGRSLKARNVFFDDHTYDSKNHVQSTAQTACS